MNDAITPTTAALVASLANAGIEPKTVGGHTHVLVPPNYAVKDITDAIEKAQDTPNRKTGTARVADVPSLLTYCADQASADSAYIYADLDERTITAVFNDHRGTDFAGWRDHRTVFAAVYTPEFEKWVGNDKKPMTQTEFAEFIEDNIGDLQGEEATNLLTVASTIQATTGINFSSAKRLQDGQTQLVYNETINATAGANGELKIPKVFSLGLRIFKNGSGYMLTARLKYRIHSGNVKFWYELERPERIVEDAFAGYVAEVAEKSGYTVLLGHAGS